MCRDHGVAEPMINVSESWGTTTFARQIEHAATQMPDKSPASSLQVRNLIHSLNGERTRAEILQSLGFKGRSNLAKEYIQPTLASGLIEMTIPDKLHSSKQKYG